MVNNYPHSQQLSKVFPLVYGLPPAPSRPIIPWYNIQTATDELLLIIMPVKKTEESSRLRRWWVQGCVPVFTGLIYGLPVLAVTLPARKLDGGFLVGWLLLAPITFSVIFVLVAGLLSWPYQHLVVEGRFPRDLGTRLYAGRRLYGLCWTAVYYCKPVYFLCLTLSPLKTLMFRLFGYRGSMDFTVYPDTWIRDLPLLDFGPGTYVANRATLGTNLVMQNGDIVVGAIRTGKDCMVGHLTMVAAGTKLGAHVCLGSGCAVGMHTHIKEDVLIGDTAAIDHYVVIGAGSVLGARSWVERRCRIPAGTVIETGSGVLRDIGKGKTNVDIGSFRIKTQSEVEYRAASQKRNPG